MNGRYELRSPSDDPEVPGGIFAFTTSLKVVANWCRQPGNTAVTPSGHVLDTNPSLSTKETDQ